MISFNYFCRCGFHLYTGSASSSLSSSLHCTFRRLPFPVNGTCKVTSLSLFFTSFILSLLPSPHQHSPPAPSSPTTASPPPHSPQTVSPPPPPSPPPSPPCPLPPLHPPT